MTLSVVPRAEIFQEDFLGGFEHAVFVMHAVKRIVAAVSAIRKRCTERIHIKHLKASFAHRPGRVCIVQLHSLKVKSMFKILLSHGQVRWSSCLNLCFPGHKSVINGCCHRNAKLSCKSKYNNKLETAACQCGSAENNFWFT